MGLMGIVMLCMGYEKSLVGRIYAAKRISFQ
jgi:hypothetical protein